MDIFQLIKSLLYIWQSILYFKCIMQFNVHINSMILALQSSTFINKNNEAHGM